MYKLSELEKEILTAMTSIMDKERIVESSMSDIVFKTGRKTVGGIHTHAMHNLESMGLIRKMKDGKWKVLKKDISERTKGKCGVVIQGIDAFVLEKVIEKLNGIGDMSINEIKDMVKSQVDFIEYHLDNYSNGDKLGKKAKERLKDMGII